MTFLSTGLLAGLLASGIPIALHLLARQKPKRVVFPATRFLKQSLDTHRDRLKIRRWWLLAMRIFAIAMLAVALARPQIHTATADAWFLVGAIALIGIALLAMATLAVLGGQSKPLRYGLVIAGLVVLLGSAIFGGVTMARAPTATVNDSTPAAVAIVIDNSIRTSRHLLSESNTPTSVIARMRESAAWMVNEQTSDSLVAIIDRSPRPATFSIDHATALTRIERTEPAAQVLSLAERVRSAITLVRSSALERKTVLLIADLTTASFESAEWQAAEMQALLNQQPPIALQILDVGSESKTNYSLSQIALGDPTPPRLAKTSVSVVVNSPKLEGDQPAKTLNVQLELYDTISQQGMGLPVLRNAKIVLPPLRSVDRTTVEANGVATRALLSVPPLDVGTHHGVVRLISEDELDADNIRYVTWVVREPKRILIVGADRVDANILADAISAPLAIDDPLAEYAIELSEFPPANVEAWKKFAAVILIDPQTPSPPLRGELDSYLRAGGHVISLLGPSLSRPEDVTDAFPSGVVLPWRIPEPGAFFEVVRPNHPAVASLRDVAGGVPWNAFRVAQYWQVTAGPADTVIIEYAGSDHPALLERTTEVRDGETVVSRGGTHLILTTPLPALAVATRSWNQLFAGADVWPAWLLIRDMVDSLVHRDQGQQNLLIGQSTRLVISQPPGDEAAEQPGQAVRPSAARIQLFAPVGPPIPLLTDNGAVTLSQLDSPGTYWLKSSGNATGVSVNLTDASTDLSRIDPALLDDWLGKEQYTLVHSHAEVRQAQGRGQATRSLYAPLLLLMLAAFVFEQLLSNRFYASRVTTAKRAVAA